VRVSQNGVGVAVDDNGGVRTMARKSHAQPPSIGGEMRCFAIAGKRVDNHDGLALETLRLIGGANQYAGYIGQTGGHGGGLLDMRRE
jgi:hypothetical protein